MAFVYDALDPDLGRELRRDRSNPLSGPSFQEWLTEVGRSRINDQADQIISTLGLCHDIDNFESRFAKVLHKTALSVQDLDEPE